jgi:hypothetical protein
MLASCGSNDDTVNTVDVNAADTNQLDDLSSVAANDAANSLEMETLGNQAAQLEEEPATENSAVANDTTTDADADAMNVSGM